LQKEARAGLPDIYFSIKAIIFLILLILLLQVSIHAMFSGKVTCWPGKYYVAAANKPVKCIES
jgi:hypothetical protein